MRIPIKFICYITKLATLGESVIAWDESDYNIFHNHLFKTDSVLLEIKLRSGDFFMSGSN